MAAKPAPSHGVMEGRGAYNKYAKIPAGGSALALPLLESAVRDITCDPADQPGGPLHRGIEVRHIDNEEATELLLGIGVRTVLYQPLAIALSSTSCQSPSAAGRRRPLPRPRL
jgi:hypothetical protein